MPNFGQIMKGTRARKRVDLPLAGAKYNLDSEKYDGRSVPVDLRSLTPGEHARVLEQARAYAIEHGVEDPNDGEALYEQGRILHTLAIACIDIDSSETDPKPFFDGGVAQIEKQEELSADHLAYLFEAQQLWEDEVSPRLKTLSQAEFLAGVFSTAQRNQGFFLNMQLGTRWSCFLTLADLHVISLTRKSSAGSDFDSETQPETQTAGSPS